MRLHQLIGALCFDLSLSFRGFLTPNLSRSFRALPRVSSNEGDGSGGLSLSPLVTGIEPSKTIEVHALTQAMMARGENVISLCVGEPDFDPPRQILDATKKVQIRCQKLLSSVGDFVLHFLIQGD